MVVEIEEFVLEASHFFDDDNGRPLEDPRTRVIAQDARAYLERTSRKFDVISSSPSSPWTSGPSKLFTHETMTLIRDHLRPGGILCQYTQAYDLDEDSVIAMMEELRRTARPMLEKWDQSKEVQRDAAWVHENA